MSLSDTAVLFDWNGTVVLDADRARDALNAVLLSRARPELSLAGFSAEFSLPMSAMFGRLGAEDAVAAEEEWNAHMATRPSVARDGAHEALGALAEGGAFLGIVSAAARVSVEYDLDSLGFAVEWDAVEAPTVDKLAVLQRYRGRRERAVYVGDTAYDVSCARRAGYLAVAVAGGYNPPDVLRAAGADHVVSDLRELLPLLGGAD
ncbi:Phosphoglycolate phosphatase, HAD superfamily [Rathayibacter oskolensis]|uniref:Phosphoglycolate phosphatase, HAD superfamily n=1 Tax=Rathayibacter oskolensis TaxID=1891671 RepID=A0A1X7MU94_9MICO|nr:HAD family hydrolase [Rathayibacter oskolensis]SMH28215.1 Phosphoglycolate phosphatase, HAD superfamily [Rathayibacter oskolensis]